MFGFHFVNADGDAVFGFNRTLEAAGGPTGSRPAGVSGSRARSTTRCCPGATRVSCLISRNRTQGDLALHAVRLLDFVVYGTRPGPGQRRRSEPT